MSFDLERALSGAEVRTKDGRIVTSLTKLDGVIDRRKSLAGVLDGAIVCWYSNGRYYFGEDSDTSLDLVTTPQKHKAYLVVHSNGEVYNYVRTKKEGDTYVEYYKELNLKVVEVEYEV